MVGFRGFNEDEIAPMLALCRAEAHDLTLIETEPLGDIEGDRAAHYLSFYTIRKRT